MTDELERAERWLQRCVGELTLVNDMKSADGNGSAQLVGTESVRAIGGPWVAFDTRTTEPASHANSSLMTLCYDPSRGRIVGAVVTSMMSNLRIYETPAQRGSIKRMTPLFAGTEIAAPGA